jgi:hypothetical protein
MTLNYSLTEQDFFEYQLHTYSHSKQNRKKFYLSYVLVVIVSSVFVAVSIQREDYRATVFTGIWFLLTLVGYPLYYRYQIKKHFKKHIKENYSKRIGNKIQIEFKEDHIYVQDQTGEGKTFYTAIEQVEETSNLFLPKLGPSQAFLIPKRSVENIEWFRDKFSEVGINILPRTENKWFE